MLDVTTARHYACLDQLRYGHFHELSFDGFVDWACLV